MICGTSCFYIVLDKEIKKSFIMSVKGGTMCFDIVLDKEIKKIVHYVCERWYYVF